MSFDMMERVRQGLSRRQFLAGALAGGAALTMTDKLALAKQIATGRTPSAQDIRGVGVQPGIVLMALNENPIGPSNHALQAIAENMFKINRYGFGRGELIPALAAADGVELPAPPQQQPGGDEFFRRRPPTPYLITASSSQVLELIALAYLSKGGGELVEADLGYLDLAQTGEFYNKEMGIPTNVIKVPVTKDYRHDLPAMLKAITPKTTMVVITNPNNPTGTLMSYQELSDFVAKVPKNVLVVIDEAYIHFVREPNYRTAISLATSNENVIVVRTFSKVYAMPAMRLGYGVSSQTIQQKLRFYMTGGPNMLAEVAGVAAIKDLDHVRMSQEVVWSFRDRCYDEFKKLGLEYIPSQSNFMMVNVSKDAMAVVREMRKRGVMVSVRAREKMPTWIRVSSGTEAETEVFLHTLKEVLNSTI
ncbi:MAG: aminotransferase class I/II-fold pyridoxal phosphate-dependent enzyme [candidate division Zixibacteria bacterium]|nr:aminotransferase class I/II-fold pyridoxal phosphate-dependent enzyme [candidate division Zixibacteria bacterium]